MQEEMKVHRHLALAFWDQEISSSPSTSSSNSSSSSSSSSLSLDLKRLRPLAPKLASSSACTAATAAAPGSSSDMIITSLTLSSSTKTITKCNISPSQEYQYSSLAGATRWNPAPEQIKVLEALYRGGTRTPNAGQIEHITSELGKYGRIEGKNVFYWFQNHKARERQKQKRSALLSLSSTDTNLLSPSHLKMQLQQEEEEEEGEEKTKEVSSDWNCKRKCRSWGMIGTDGHDQISGSKNSDCTLDLFPLHPEGKADQIIKILR